jgi:DNA-binding response OmpR family regulator
MVVDDEEPLATTLVRVLQASGYDARAVFNAEQALNLFREFGPEVIISDVVMPGTNGVELAMRMRDVCPDCIVVLFSGNAATEQILEQARIQGFAFDVIAKPIHPRELLKRLRDILGSCTP